MSTEHEGSEFVCSLLNYKNPAYVDVDFLLNFCIYIALFDSAFGYTCIHVCVYVSSHISLVVSILDVCLFWNIF